MLTILCDLNRVLSARDRLLAGGVLLVAILMAGVEVLGVGAVFWFISELANPEGLTRIKPLADLRMALGMPDRDDFLIWVGGLLLVIMILRNLLQVFSVWAQQSFILFRNHAFATRLLHAYLRRPYAAYLRSHTSELSKNLLNEVNRVASGVLYPVVNSISCMVILVSITAFLLFQDPATTAVIALVVGLLAVLCYVPLHRRLDRLGRERMAADAMRFRAIDDALSSVKDVRVLGREAYFLDRFVAASRMFMRRELLHKVLSQIPHFTLELVAVVGVLGGALFAYANDPGNAPRMIATLGLYAVAAYRLLPQLKSIVRDLTDLRFSIASLESLANDIEDGLAYQAAVPAQRRPLPFNRSIELENVSFAYEGSAMPTLCEISLHISSRTSVAFVGHTGAGKTTLIDLILGLLHPTSGTIRIDGQVLTAETTAAWQANVGYVPQSTFLADDSIRRNIAFGIADDAIVDADVRRAAHLANVGTFVENLPHGYDTPIGERGVRLSGGQRQRIGIARALYHRPRLLVMDEGTSALDGGTERAIADAIAGLTPEITVILIAHRLATVRSCHAVFLLQAGRLIDQGTFDELVASNAQFRKMAELA